MKLIFVVSSVGGGAEEYEECWQECLENGKWREIQNEADKKIEINTNSGIELHIFNGFFYSQLYQGDVVTQLAKRIMSVVKKRNDLDPPVFVCFHGSGRKMRNLKQKLEDDTKIVFECKEYHHDDNFYRDYIIPFGICDNDISNLVEKLLKEVEGKRRTTEALTLRYEILSPLVALDLILQAEGNNKLDGNINLTEIRREIQAAIKDLNTPVKEFCQGAIACDKFKKQLDNLITSDGDCGWEEYHVAVKKVAEGMEEQIAMI